jgi:hypothetical protein
VAEAFRIFGGSLINQGFLIWQKLIVAEDFHVSQGHNDH